MADDTLVDRLDETIAAIVGRRDATAALRDETLAPLARIAADLRHVPAAAFKARLRAQLERRTKMSVTVAGLREGLTTVSAYVMVPVFSGPEVEQ